MKKALIALLIAGPVFLALVPAPVVKAQSGWSHTFHLAVTNGGFVTYDGLSFWETTDRGQWVSGSGWRSVYVHRAGFVNQRSAQLNIKLEMEDSVTVDSAVLHYSFQGGVFDAVFDPVYNQFKIGAASVTRTANGAEIDGPDRTLTLDAGPYTFDTIDISLIASWAESGETGSATATSITFTGETGDDPFADIDTGFSGIGFKPVKATDELVSENITSTTLPQLTYLIDTTTHANVYTISSGMVTRLDTGPTGFRLTIETGDIEVVYYNMGIVNAKIGDLVDAGCVLGTAGNQYRDNAAEEPPEISDYSQVTLTYPEDFGDYHSWQEPTSTTPCNADDTNTAHCLDNNPNFAQDDDGIIAGGWQHEGGVIFWPVDDTPNAKTVAVMSPGGQVYQRLLLETGESYVMTAMVGGHNKNSSVKFFIGNASQTMPLSIEYSGKVKLLTTSVIIPTAATYTDGTFAVGIGNVSASADLGNEIDLTYLCVSLESDPASVAPGSCYFQDSTLTSDSWESDEVVTFRPGLYPGAPGAYVIPQDARIWQAVDIQGFQDADADYRLKFGAASGSLIDTPEITADIEDTDTFDPIRAIGSVTLDSLFPPNTVALPQTLPFTVPLGEHDQGVLVIENTSASDTDVIVSNICLEVEGGIWPGYDNRDTTFNDLLQTECPTCVIPADWLDLGGWINWLGCILVYLIKCLLFGLINGIWRTIGAILLGVGLLGRWLGGSIASVAGWAWRGLGYLVGALLAGIIPIANAILAWLVSMPFVTNILDVISLAGIWLAGLFDLVLAVFNLFGLGIQMLGAIFKLFSDAWLSLITAIGTTSGYSFTFPDCGNPLDPLYDTCIGLETVNFFIQHIPMITVFGTLAAVAIGWKQIAAAWEEADEALRML